jgi:hypothetical protein
MPSDWLRVMRAVQSKGIFRRLLSRVARIIETYGNIQLEAFGDGADSFIQPKDDVSGARKKQKEIRKGEE